MQQIPSTCFSFTPFQQLRSYPVSISSTKLQDNSKNYSKGYSISPDSRGFKKRLQIFKEYKPKQNSVSENDDTVVYNKRRRGADSQKGKQSCLPTCQRQFQNSKKLNRYGSGDNLGSESSKKRHKIFSSLKPIRVPNYQIPMSQMHQSQVQPLITTQRLRKNIENAMPAAPEPEPQLLSLFSTIKDNNSNQNIKYVYSRTSSLEKLGQGQAQPGSVHTSQQKRQVPNTLTNSPNKITFTYQDPPNYAGAQQLTIPKVFVPNLICSQSSETLNNNKKVSFVQQSFMPRSLVDTPSPYVRSSMNNVRSLNEKKTLDFADRQMPNRSKTHNTVSWGNKIRTELMGKTEIEYQSMKGRQPGSSKVSLHQVKQSLIINGEKIAMKNLKINESFSNLSDDHSSKRYFDEEGDCLPEVKKISYNNIDISVDESGHKQEDFNPNQLLLLELQSQKFQKKNSKSLDIFDMSPVDRPDKKMLKKQDTILQKSILKELSQEMRPEQIVKQTNKAGKLLPAILILLATLLFVIQAVL